MMKIRTKIAKLAYDLRHRDVPRVRRQSELSRAADGQDEYIAHHLLSHVQRGVFVEIGGNDGVTLSNTYYFERELDWQGICIEPLPRAYEDLRKNRKCTTVHGAVTDYDGVTSFLEISGPCEMLSGIPDKYDVRHARRVRKNLRRHKATSREITVPCYTLATVLRQHGLGHVDYLSVDTEGGELEILESIDMKALKIRVVSVENNYFTRGIEDYMIAHGYRFAALAGRDEIYALA